MWIQVQTIPIQQRESFTKKESIGLTGQFSLITDILRTMNLST